MTEDTVDPIKLAEAAKGAKGAKGAKAPGAKAADGNTQASSSASGERELEPLPASASATQQLGQGAAFPQGSAHGTAAVSGGSPDASLADHDDRSDAHPQPAGRTGRPSAISAMRPQGEAGDSLAEQVRAHLPAQGRPKIARLRFGRGARRHRPATRCTTGTARTRGRTATATSATG